MNKRTVTATLLVAGTSIGGGMLALPIATGIAGFLPSMTMMILCWLAMTLSALLLAEATLWFEGDVHLISMSTRLLGRGGKWASWFLYLFICYASIIAYTAGGGLQLSFLFSQWMGFEVSKGIGCTVFALLFGGIVLMGSGIVGRINSLLFLALIGAYIALVGLGLDEVKLSLLSYCEWSNGLIAIPLLLTAFSFQTLIPSLALFLNRDRQAMRLAIIGGTLVALMIYTIWQWVILGIVPVEGENGLAAALAKGDLPVTQFLKEHVSGVWVYSVAEFFAFFAIITSFLGIALGLFDFLADGLGIKKTGNGLIQLGLLILIPTLIVAIWYERAFIAALDATGGFGDTLLNGIIPILLVWKGRVFFKEKKHPLVPGGKLMLFLLALYFSFCFFLELAALLGLVPSVYEAYDILEVHNLG